jgi:glycosyltransferase involved in cell wall biosynthesis
MINELTYLETGPRMKVCYYNHTGKVSGAERVLFTLLSKIGPDFETSLIAPDTAPMRTFCANHGIRHLPIDELRARFTMNPFRLVRYIFSGVRGISQVRRLVLLVAPDVLHANSTRAGMIACLATLGSKTPVVWHVHDQFREHPITSLVRVVLGSSRRNSVIAVSQATAAAVRGNPRSPMVERVPVSVIYNGIDGDLYGSQELEAETFLEKEALKNSAFRVAVIGQITPRKGQLGAIETFARLVHSHAPAAQLLVVGSPVFNNDHLYLQRLQDRVKQLGIESNVRFMGHRTDIPIILRSCHAVVSNSSSEPFSLVLLEACASATPVLASAVDGVPELVLDGITGKLFPYGDSDAMLNALMKLNSDREYGKRLGIAARQRALLHFTQERFLRQVRQFYIGLAGALPASGSHDTAKQSGASYTLEGYEQARSWGTHDA